MTILTRNFSKIFFVKIVIQGEMVHIFLQNLDAEKRKCQTLLDKIAKLLSGFENKRNDQRGLVQLNFWAGHQNLGRIQNKI